MGLVNDKYESLKTALEEHYDFPCSYTFKFVVPKERSEDVEKLIEGATISHRPSSNGKYVSVTLVAVMDSSEAVLDVYRASLTEYLMDGDEGGADLVLSVIIGVLMHSDLRAAPEMRAEQIRRLLPLAVPCDE